MHGSYLIAIAAGTWFVNALEDRVGRFSGHTSEAVNALTEDSATCKELESKLDSVGMRIARIDERLNSITNALISGRPPVAPPPAALALPEPEPVTVPKPSRAQRALQRISKDGRLPDLEGY